MKKLLLVLFGWVAGSMGAAADPPAPGSLALANAGVRLRWERSAEGWRVADAVAISGGGERSAGKGSGEYTVLYSADAPSPAPIPVPWAGSPAGFPEPTYHGATAMWRQATGSVALNTAGTAVHFFPQEAAAGPDGAVVFSHHGDVADLRAEWRADPAFAGDVRVTLVLTARKAGYFSIATPTLTVIPRADLAWAMVPGIFAGAAFEPDLVRSYGYGQGLPELPVLARERSASTLASLATLGDGVTVAVVAEPGTATDPWASDHNTRPEWRLGLSHLNRRGDAAPTLYHPVLGQVDSSLAVGESRTFRFRYTLRRAGWYAVLQHEIYDVYRLSDFLTLKKPERSLSSRLLSLGKYLEDPVKSKWHPTEDRGVKIGAQNYGSGTTAGVVGSDGDAIKNSDYGAMWMLGSLTGNPIFTQDRLPLARAFKLMQQQTGPGFFQGAAVGQYYLWKSHRFTEEWGDYVEPVGLTYYTLCDLGNMLLFQPGDAELRQRLRLGADRLLGWQHPDGHWEVAYDRMTTQPKFTDLSDYRPTFYGLLVAYRTLGDEKYLAAARRGADWLIEHAVNPAHFLGVCGDNRFAPDFATGQIAEGLEQLFDATHDQRYQQAAIATARFYVTSIYTHPIASEQPKQVNGVKRADWEISQMGLSYEHGGTFGSTNGAGPILLASHAGMFIRMHQLTGEPLFRDLARAGALARDAFLDPETQVASYYWLRMNAGAGPYPHHAWWQIGWITDYMLSEASLRSHGQIVFPRGFMTPKVGPQTTYGFAPGRIFGHSAALAWGEAGVDRPEVDTLLARDERGQRLWIIAMNDSAGTVTAQLNPAVGPLTGGHARAWRGAAMLSATGQSQSVDSAAGRWSVTLPAFGLAVLALDY